MPPAGKRILVVDHHPILREGVVAIISSSLAEAKVTGSADFPDALAHIRRNPVDLIVTDFRIQGEVVLSFLQDLKEANHKARCLILSALDEIQIGYPCIRAGASGFVKKCSPVPTVLDAARMVLMGNHYISEGLSKALMHGHGPETNSSPGSHLTNSELRIFTMIGECMSVSMIAAKIGISVKTVESHRENIKNKLGYHNAAQVAAAAIRWLDDTPSATHQSGNHLDENR